MQNYHKHCSESNIFIADSAASYMDYVNRAVELGHKVISTVEHGWQGRYHFALDTINKYKKQYKEKHNMECPHEFKLIFGAEAYWVKDNQAKDRTNAHIILLAKNENGRRKINGILSDANEFGYYFQPRVDEKSILSLPPDDVFVTSACIGFWKYDKTEPGYTENLIKKLKDHFGDNFMLEVQYHHTEEQRELNKKILQFADKYNIDIIAGMDSHYIYPEQEMEREYILEAKRIHYDDEEGWFMDYPDDATTFQRFADQGILTEEQIRRAMDNTDLLLDFEDFTVDNPIFSYTPKLPTLYDGKHTINGKLLPKLNQEERNKLYSVLISKLFKKYLEENVPRERWDEYFEGVKQEVDVIKETGMADYFLIDYEIVKDAVENGASLTNSGRGSAVGYFTNTLLGFSKVDRFTSPIKLYPERFISKSRILETNSLPDIDLNWGTPEIAEKSQEKIMGKNHAYPMIAFGTFKKKSAFKLYARSQDLDFDIANEISKQIAKYETAVKYADDEDRKHINIYDYVDTKYHDYITQSEPYWGIIADKKKAPCSYLLYAGDIREEIGLIKCKSESTKKEYITTVIDGSVAENYKFLKNDILKVDVVLLTDLIYKRINMKPHTVKELTDAVAVDEKVWDIYAKGLTIGVNQCEKDSTMDKVKKYQPQNVSELAAFIAGIRPGFKTMYSTFAAREPYEYGLKEFDSLIQTEQFPFSFIMYQEQLMTTLNYAGFPIDQCYQIIKDISKKKADKVKPLKDQFIKGFAKKIINDCESPEASVEMAERIWQIVDDSTAYSFNSSHAYCMALDSLYNAWQKANYPYEFYEVLLQVFSDKGKKDKVAELKKEMLIGFGIREGQYRWGVDNRNFVANPKEQRIEPALISIKGLSQGLANDLYKLSQTGSYDNFYEVWKAVNKLKTSNSAKINTLVEINYFEEFGSIKKIKKFLSVMDLFYERSQFHISDEVVSQYPEIIEKFCANKTEKQYRGFDYDAALLYLWNSLEDEKTPIKEQLQYEFENFGYVKTILPELDADFAMVIKIDGKYKNKTVTLYRLFDGSQENVKVKGYSLDMHPLTEGDIIKTIECKEDHKWRKGADGFYQTDEKELILTKWREVN